MDCWNLVHFAFVVRFFPQSIYLMMSRCWKPWYLQVWLHVGCFGIWLCRRLRNRLGCSLADPSPASKTSHTLAHTPHHHPIPTPPHSTPEGETLPHSSPPKLQPTFFLPHLSPQTPRFLSQNVFIKIVIITWCGCKRHVIIDGPRYLLTMAA